MDDILSNAEVLEQTVDGHYTSSKWRHLSEMLRDYNPSLELLWQPPTSESRAKCPYVIAHTDKVGRKYIVMLLEEGDALEYIMEKVINADARNGNQLTRMQARNFAIKMVELKRKMDFIEQQKDITRFLLETKKVNPTVRDPRTGELVKYDQQFNRIPIRTYH